MKVTKLLALGLLSAMTVTSLAGNSVFAAEAGGATNFEYTPGQSTGQNPDGTLADWTVDYPVKVVLNDSTVSYDSGINMPFTLLNTKKSAGGTQDTYTGAETVTVKLATHANTVGSTGIQMKDGQNAQQNVVMTLGSGASSQFRTDQDTTIGTMAADPDNELSIKAWLTDKTGAEDGKTYTQTLTWKFSDQ
ncbi:hypothetical protein [Clostridium sp. AUH-JLR23]|uniref:hypothetical protein n=1 Tax=Clostridium sp. AUH-JLR23 TaxID=1505062 RepID=UPI003567A019